MPLSTVMRLLYIQCIQPNGLDFFFKERSFGNEDRAVSSDPNPLDQGLSLYPMSTVITCIWLANDKIQVILGLALSWFLKFTVLSSTPPIGKRVCPVWCGVINLQVLAKIDLHTVLCVILVWSGRHSRTPWTRSIWSRRGSTTHDTKISFYIKMFRNMYLLRQKYFG